MNWCILIPLLVGLLSALFGYLLGRLSSGSSSNDSSDDIDFWRNKNAQLEKDLAACRSKLSAGAGNTAASFTAGSGAAVAATAAAITPTTASVAFDAGAAKAAFGKTIKQDDLTLVEGIGPKISELFHNYDIGTWATLGATSVERCQEILDTGGERYSVHNPGTWPRQSEMAANGKWQQLKDWQDILDHGKE